MLDESAEEKAAAGSAGAGRPYNGRLGQVEMSQVGVFLAYANLKAGRPVWSGVEGELFLSEAGFEEEQAPLCRRLRIPKERTFQTKIELGWEMIQRVQANGLPFEIVAFDSLYGQSGWWRTQWRQAALTSIGEVPRDTQVYLQEPVLGIPERTSARGRPPSQVQVLSDAAPVSVETLRQAPETRWQTVRGRPTERGELCDRFAARRVWTVYEGPAIQEWRVMRREAHGRYSYALSHAPAETSLAQLAEWKCQRYFVERAHHQEAQSELGWDELQAQKYRAWEHHLALTVMASWFIAQTQYVWAQRYERDPDWLQELEVEVLPAFSFAHVRSLWRAVMPLRQLDPQQAIDPVVEHLFNRTQSRKSRMKRHPIKIE